jgi:hypothetical protein
MVKMKIFIAIYGGSFVILVHLIHLVLKLTQETFMNIDREIINGPRKIKIS